ncbi:MAG: FMN-binding glutamate synthase family protein [Flavobacteriales bacterium]
MRNKFILFSIITIIGLIGVSFIWTPVLWVFVLVGPLIVLGFVDLFQKKHTIMMNYPILGRGRYIMEQLRPKIYQYFIESEVDGRPLNRMFRSIVYQRAKDTLDTNPFGTKLDFYQEGYEWMNHSFYPKDNKEIEKNPKVKIGSKDCKKPYEASILNISAMSYGSLSDRAVLALNGGAKKRGFAQNTGEGGISEYHLRPGGDLIWQIGTGYFGCRDKEGNFNDKEFEKKSRMDAVKMIEVKLSQGAKPGHGGILPACKNTEEIAKIRGVIPHKDIHSPPFHTEFKDSKSLLEFIAKLRELSGGKPVGFKMCVGNTFEFEEVCQTMINTGIKPDFITVDGGEGGTGAAPLEYSNSVGMPLKEGLAYTVDLLKKYELKKEIKIISSGKIISAFHIFKALAIGADLCYSARAMMLAIGCIQALECNNNTCPTGITTQNKSLIKGLNVVDKTSRVANFHRETVESFVELLFSAGLSSPEEIQRKHINRRINMTDVKRFDEIFPEEK